VTYVIQSDKGRSLDRSETVQRFLLWILQSKAVEIGTIYENQEPPILNG
jgi:hypothetical protein